MIDFVIDKTCTQTIDARGLVCPLPLLKAKQGLNNLASGERLQVLATDSASVRDFHAFVALSRHSLAAFKQTGNVYCYLLVKGVEIPK
jgi:tRNA 2-thiouridine synthesizing protein A